MSTWLDEIIKEEYDFVKVLKSNENSEIVVFRHKATGRKFVRRVFSGKSDVYKILQKISNERIPKIYEVIEQDGKCEVFEEYVDGISIAELLSESEFDEKGVRRIAGEICEGLSVLHSKDIIHRDIKPANIMISENGDVKIIDFGAARIYNPFAMQDTEILGTVNYAPPEQFGVSQTDGRADIYSLGITMNVMLTKQAPSRKMYDGKLKKVITKCIMNDPNQRYKNAMELKKALQ